MVIITFEEKAKRLDEIFSRLAEISNETLVLETERDRIINSFSEEEVELWGNKVQNDYYESMKDIEF